MIARREMCWSEVDRRGRSTLPYLDHLVRCVRAEHVRVLFVGCGGGVGPSALAATRPELQIEIVEPFSEVEVLARRYFELSPAVEVHHEEGGAFLAVAPAARWDAILVDAYGSGDLAREVPTTAFVRAAHRGLVIGGVLAINVVAEKHAPEFRSVVETMTSVFGASTTVVDVQPGASGVRNFVVRATRG